jgi:hypothetical protein
MCPNSFASVRPTHFKVRQCRREAGHWRLRCAVRLRTARRVSLERNDSAPPRERANIKMRAVRSGACGFASASARRRPTQSRGRCCQWNCSVGPFRLGRGQCLKKRASFWHEPQAPSSGTEHTVVSSLHVCDTEPLHFLLPPASVRPNSSGEPRRTVFKLRQSRCEAYSRRLQCST